MIRFFTGPHLESRFKPQRRTNMSAHSVVKCFIVMMLLLAGSALAQAPAASTPSPSFYATPIGQSISLENAKKAAAAATSEARKNGWLQAVAVVSPGGFLVYYEKMDNTQLASADLAIDKARSAALYKRPTKVFADGLGKGGANLRILTLRGASAVEGGLPIIIDGKLVGAIGASGDTVDHDDQCAAAGVAALK
jgi:glc operon protein GlcG